MKQKVSPAIAAGAAGVVILLVAGYIFFQNRQSAGQAEKIAQHGQQAGEKMKQSMNGSMGYGTTSAPGQQSGQRMMQQMGQPNGQP